MLVHTLSVYNTIFFREAQVLKASLSPLVVCCCFDVSRRVASTTNIVVGRSRCRRRRRSRC